MAKKKAPKKEIVFKLIELPTHQFLIEKTYEDEGDPSITLVIHHKDARLKQVLVYHDEEVRDKDFDEMTPKAAQKITDKLTKIFDNK